MQYVILLHKLWVVAYALKHAIIGIGVAIAAAWAVEEAVK